jgi:hypothetical protein
MMNCWTGDLLIHKRRLVLGHWLVFIDLKMVFFDRNKVFKILYYLYCEI